MELLPWAIPDFRIRELFGKESRGDIVGFGVNIISYIIKFKFTATDNLLDHLDKEYRKTMREKMGFTQPSPTLF